MRESHGMNAILSPCIAWGAEDVEAAVAHYVQHCGFSIKTRGEGWVELDSGGPQRIFICDEDGRTPTFELLVENVPEALDSLVAAGWAPYGTNESNGDVYVQDPFGRFFCLSPKQNVAPEGWAVEPSGFSG